jgi:hypothetical protein
MIGKLILLLLLALGVGLALPSTRPRIVGPVVARIYAEMTPRRLEMIATRLDDERATGQALPDNDGLERWILRNTTLSPRDPWGNRYYIERRGDGFVLGSNGPDGVRGNADDITASRRVLLR